MKRLTIASLLLLCGFLGLFFDLKNPNSFVKALTTGWAINGDDVYFNDGNVGIGTDTPSALFQVSSKISGGTHANPVLKSEVYDGDGEFSKLLSPVESVVQGNYLYTISSGEDSLVISDISNKSNPILKSEIFDGDGEFTKLDNPRGIAIQDNYVFIVSYGDHSLTIIDVSNPTNPNLVSESYDGDGEFTKLSMAHDIVLNDDYAYIVSLGDTHLTVVDISNLSSPQQVGLYNFDTDVPSFIKYYNNHVYVTYGYGLRILNVSTPTAPTSVKNMYYTQTGMSGLHGSQDLFVTDNTLFVAAHNASSVTIFDITTPASATLISQITDGSNGFNKLYHSKDVYVNGDYLYISAESDKAVTIADISNLSNPAMVKEFYDDDGTFNRIYNPKSITSDGNYIYISSVNDSAITIVEVDTGYNQILNASSEGKVGINTLTPTATLDVNGFMKLKVNTAAPATCDANANGSVALSSSYTTCVCKNGTGWVKTSDGSSSCSW